MPTYEYECGACGHAFEEFQSMSAEPLTRCPECKKNKVRRLLGTGAGLLFKGSGFYETDYRSESYKKGESAAKSGESSSKSDGDTKKKSDSAKSDKKKSSESKKKKDPS